MLIFKFFGAAKLAFDFIETRIKNENYFLLYFNSFTPCLNARQASHLVVSSGLTKKEYTMYFD